MDYNELQQMTVIKLREEVKKFPDVKGVTGMKKDELIQLLVDKLGIEVTEKQAKKTKKTKTQKVLSKDDLKNRTKKFALRIIKPGSSLPNTLEARLIGRELLKSGTSVGANYREATRSRSKAEFRAKIGIVEQEADETLYWLELLEESGIVEEKDITDLIVESDELVAIFTSIGKSSKK